MILEIMSALRVNREAVLCTSFTGGSNGKGKNNEHSWKERRKNPKLAREGPGLRMAEYKLYDK